MVYRSGIINSKLLHGCEELLFLLLFVKTNILKKKHSTEACPWWTSSSIMNSLNLPLYLENIHGEENCLPLNQKVRASASRLENHSL